jgi:elongation factor Ts
MTKITIEEVKKLREKTGAPVIECRNALRQALRLRAQGRVAQGDEKKAIEILRKKGLERAAKKKERETKAGVVASYIHADQTKGATVILSTETDFVARHQDFQKLAQEIAMQVTAMEPKDIKELLEQNWIRDDQKTIQALIDESIAKFGENIKVEEFKRFAV